MVKISASILSADFANLGNEIKALEQAGADMIHLDIMDGLFVPNITIGPTVISALRPYTKLPFDVHLMIDRPEKSIDDYIKVGANMITIHPESTIHLDKAVSHIKNSGIKAGISLLPSTSDSVIDYIIDKIDLILVMTVNPGFGGQEFIWSQLEKIKIIAEKIKKTNRDIILSVDGGINDITARACIAAGSDLLVSGSFIFQSRDYKNQILRIRSEGH
jgi:ribulose-phosphate 3-epimerase